MAGGAQDRSEPGAVVHAGAGSAATGDDSDVVDAEIVEPDLTPGAAGELELLTDYSADGVPTLDYVRDKIEGRYATSTGSTELAKAAADREAAARAAADDQAARTADQQREAREQAGRDRLAEIRRSMRP